MKRKLFGVLLPECPFVRIDATRPDVDVPGAYRTDSLVLRIGENAGRRQLFTRDLHFDASGFSGDAMLQGVWQRVRVPWAAVYGMWLEGDSAGPEVVVGLRTGPVEARSTARPLGHLRSV